MYNKRLEFHCRCGRPVDIDPELKLAGDQLSGVLVFSGREIGELALTCVEA